MGPAAASGAHGNPFDAITSGITNAVQTVTGGVQTAINKTSEGLTTATTAVTRTVDKGVNGTKEAVNTVGTEVKKVETVGQQAVESVKNATSALKGSAGAATGNSMTVAAAAVGVVLLLQLLVM